MKNKTMNNYFTLYKNDLLRGFTVAKSFEEAAKKFAKHCIGKNWVIKNNHEKHFRIKISFANNCAYTSKKREAKK